MHDDNVPVRLQDHRQELQNLNPLDAAAQAESYEFQPWAEHIGADDEDLQFLDCLCQGEIARGHLAGLARTAHDQRNCTNARRLFLGAMLWGYGQRGYGPWRTAQMLAATNARELLKSTLDLVLEGHIQKAYNRSNLPRCGSAFFTKYFYFAGLGSSDLEFRPLILDSVVMNALEQGLNLKIACFGQVARKKDGRISEVRRDAAGYERYVRRMNAWADELQCRPDSIELFLFRLGKALNAPQRCHTSPCSTPAEGIALKPKKMFSPKQESESWHIHRVTLELRVEITVDKVYRTLLAQGVNLKRGKNRVLGHFSWMVNHGYCERTSEGTYKLVHEGNSLDQPELVAIRPGLE